MTLFVIAWQSTETHDAAKSTRDSVEAIKRQTDIQAAGMKQWVDVQAVTTKGRKSLVVDGDTLYISMEVWFRAANQTIYPLTIREILVKISRVRPDGPKWEEYSKERGYYPPAPNK